ncbi:MAG: class I SAM-dependent methyltransferase [Solirubrobacteraceae bacterium MAG38_C4-C5]|nr:class I SAM-dependent methyltransferase [Candidatus Siliceabacter maunaloa]
MSDRAVSRRGLLGLGLRHLAPGGDEATPVRDDLPSPREPTPSRGEPTPSLRARWAAAWEACHEMALWDASASQLVGGARYQAGERVLDAGAGDGNVALRCALRGAVVTACEPSAALGEHARTRARRQGLTLEPVQGGLEALPFPEASFDHALAGLAPMFCLQTPAATLTELFRVVRPGGSVGLSAWLSRGPIGGLLRLAGRWDPVPVDVPGPLAWGSEERLRQEIEPFGGEDLDFELATVEMRFADEEEAAGRLRSALAPLAAAHDLLPAGAAGELRAQVAALVAKWAQPAPEGIGLSAPYLVVRARRAAT